MHLAGGLRPDGFLPDGDRVWFQSNKGDDVDLTGLYIMDLATGEMELFERDPEGEVDFGGVMLSPATDELLATVYVGDRPRVYPHDENFAADLEFLRENLPEGEIGINSMTADERLALVSLSRDVDPGTVYLFDRAERRSRSSTAAARRSIRRADGRNAADPLHRP
jgi:hypothetical protein